MITRLAILVLSLLVLLSCASKKKVFTIQEKEIVKEKIQNKDSIVKTEESLPIKDTVFISLKTDDDLVDSLVNIRLKNLYISRKSGNNKYVAKYDTINKGLKIESSISGSKQTEVSTINNTYQKEHNKEKKETKTIIKKGISFSFYLYIILIIILLLTAWYIKIKYF